MDGEDVRVPREAGEIQSVWSRQPALLDAVADDVSAAAQPFLLRCPRLVGLYALDAYFQLTGNLLVAESLGDELEHILFAPAEFAAVAVACRRNFRRAHRRLFGNGRIEVDRSLIDRPDGAEQLVRRRSCQEISPRS